MITQHKTFVIGAVCTSLILCAWLARTAPAQVQAENERNADKPAESQVPWLRLEPLARSAEGGDENDVRALSDEVFGQYHGFPMPSAEATAPIRERLVQAEVRYRRGLSKGVDEKDLVATLNGLAEKLGAPDYAKVDSHQVRKLRLAALIYTPAFMGKDLTRGPIAVGEGVNSTMSPLQAVHLALLVVEQKLINPEYQWVPSDWSSSQRALSLQKAQAHQHALESGSPPSSDATPRVDIQPNHKRAGIEEAVGKKFAMMDPLDALQLAHEALDTLGVER